MRIITQTLPLRANVHKNLLPAVRMLFGIAALGYVGWNLYRLSLSELVLWKDSLVVTPLSLFFFFIAISLTIVNWGIEAAKWKMITAPLQHISWLQATKGVLFGISLGMITPKRTGEFAGKIIILQPENRIKGLVLNSLTGMSQLFITLFMGSLAILYWMVFIEDSAFIRAATLPYNFSFFLSVGLLLALTILGLIYTASLAAPVIKKKRYSGRIISVLLSTLTLASRQTLSSILLLSAVRYGVFVTQFYLLAVILGLQVPLIDFVAITGIMYLIMTLIPLSAIWELGIRGSVALFVFGIYLPGEMGYEAAVVAASTGLWVINLALPAIVGGLWALRTENENLLN